MQLDASHASVFEHEHKFMTIEVSIISGTAADGLRYAASDELLSLTEGERNP